MRAVRAVLVCICLGLFLGLAGCSGGTIGGFDQASRGGASAGAQLTGAVHGGQQPIVGAHVYLFAANITGYGGAGIAASSGNASISLLTSAGNTSLDTSGGTTNGDYYVTTDSGGNFSITGDYTFWIANTAADTTNNSGSNIAELSSLGTVLSGSTGFTDSGTKQPNGIAIDTYGNVWVSTRIGASKFSSDGSFLLYPHSSQYSSGGAYDIAIDGAGNAWVSELNLLPEFTNAGTAAASSEYLNNGLQSKGVAIDGAGSAWASDTTGYVTVVSRTGVFVSGTNGYLAGGCCFSSIGGIALDSAGDAWVTHNGFPGAIFKLSNSGSNLSGSGGFGGTGINGPTGIAVDGAGMVWVSTTYAGIEELSPSGLVLSGSQGFQPAATNQSGNPAVDGSGNVWQAVSGFNIAGSYIVELVGAATPVITPIAAGLPSTPTTDGSSNLGTRP